MDLEKLFKKLEDENYCIIKISKAFPDYSAGEDVDIFCYHPSTVANKILEWGNEYVRDSFEIKVKNDTENDHIYVDFMHGKEIHLRFDIYGRLPKYKNLLIKPALFESIIEHSNVVDCKNTSSNIKIKVPDKTDEMILRYIEFIEWYNVRPDKIKHLDYIMEQLEGNNKFKFLDKLHHYTAFPEYGGEDSCGSLKRLFTKIRSKLKKA